jgi:hypothetical protein
MTRVKVNVGGEIVEVEHQGKVEIGELAIDPEKRSALEHLAQALRSRPLKFEKIRYVDESDPESDVELVDAEGRVVGWMPRDTFERLSDSDSSSLRKAIRELKMAP